MPGAKLIHPGVDVNYYNGAPIHSLFDGVVKYINRTGTGTVSVYSQNPGIVCNYVHMADIPGTLAVDTQITAGQLIGTQGAMGTDSSHLHFEIRPASKQNNGPAIPITSPSVPMPTILPYGYMNGVE